MGKKLNSARCFLFDMDGTVYLGKRLLPGASDLMSYLEEQQIPYFFLTNNSSRSRTDYVSKLADLGLRVALEKIFTSGEATALYLQRRQPGAKLYLVGTPSLEKEFTQFGFELVGDNPDFAVLGFDTTLTYEKIRILCDFVRCGVPYIATHPDINCPTEDGYMPDIGAMMALVSASTGRKPDVIVGKPFPPMVEAITAKTGFEAQEMAIVGDRLYTDIAMGEAGLMTVLVLSGETQPEDLEGATLQPDVVVQDLADLYSKLVDSKM